MSYRHAEATLAFFLMSNKRPRFPVVLSFKFEKTATSNFKLYCCSFLPLDATEGPQELRQLTSCQWSCRHAVVVKGLSAQNRQNVYLTRIKL
jgi:hypothetical protein